MLTKQEFFPLFWVDNENSLDDFRTLSCVESVLSCLEGNTSKLSQRLRISCIDARADPSMLSSFVLSSGKRLVFALFLPLPLYFFSNKIRKGKKKIIFHFSLPFVTLKTSWCPVKGKEVCLHSLKLHFFFAWFQKHMWTFLRFWETPHVIFWQF